MALPDTLQKRQRILQPGMTGLHIMCVLLAETTLVFHGLLPTRIIGMMTYIAGSEGPILITTGVEVSIRREIRNLVLSMADLVRQQEHRFFYVGDFYGYGARSVLRKVDILVTGNMPDIGGS